MTFLLSPRHLAAPCRSANRRPIDLLGRCLDYGLAPSVFRMRARQSFQPRSYSAEYSAGGHSLAFPAASIAALAASVSLGWSVMLNVPFCIAGVGCCIVTTWLNGCKA